MRAGGDRGLGIDRGLGASVHLSRRRHSGAECHGPGFVQRVNDQKTLKAQQAKRHSLPCGVSNNPFPLDQLQKQLNDAIFQLRAAESYAEVDKALWSEFLTGAKTTPPAPRPWRRRMRSRPSPRRMTAMQPALRFSWDRDIRSPASGSATRPSPAFKQAFEKDPDLVAFTAAVKKCLSPFIESGLLERRMHTPDDGDASASRCTRSARRPACRRLLDMGDVRISQVDRRLEANLERNCETVELAEQVYNWLRPQVAGHADYDRGLTDGPGGGGNSGRTPRWILRGESVDPGARQANR